MKCSKWLLVRHIEEYKNAPKETKMSKLKALQIFRKYGWKDVFKESLNQDKTAFKTMEEHARFQFCTID